MRQRLLLAVTLAALFGATSAQAARDHFNKGSLGPQWQVDVGTMEVMNKRLVGSDGSIARNTQATDDNAAYVEVRASGLDVQYGAVVVGYESAEDNVFLKVQSQNDLGTFDTVGLYYGNNGAGQFILAPELSEYSVLWIKGRVAGSEVRLAVDVNLDGKADYVYTYDFGNGIVFGRGAGLGVFGPTSLDYFMSRPGPSSQPPAEDCAAPCKLIRVQERAPAIDATR